MSEVNIVKFEQHFENHHDLANKLRIFEKCIFLVFHLVSTSTPFTRFYFFDNFNDKEQQDGTKMTKFEKSSLLTLSNY